MFQLHECAFFDKVKFREFLLDPLFGLSRMWSIRGA